MRNELFPGPARLGPPGPGHAHTLRSKAKIHGKKILLDGMRRGTLRDVSVHGGEKGGLCVRIWGERGNSTGHNGFANHCLALFAWPVFNETEPVQNRGENVNKRPRCPRMGKWMFDDQRCSLKKTLVDADVRVVREERNFFQPGRFYPPKPPFLSPPPSAPPPPPPGENNGYRRNFYEKRPVCRESINLEMYKFNTRYRRY